MVAEEQGISAMPTFIFYRDSKKVNVNQPIGEGVVYITIVT